MLCWNISSADSTILLEWMGISSQTMLLLKIIKIHLKLYAYEAFSTFWGDIRSYSWATTERMQNWYCTWPLAEAAWLIYFICTECIFWKDKQAYIPMNRRAESSHILDVSLQLKRCSLSCLLSTNCCLWQIQYHIYELEVTLPPSTAVPACKLPANIAE